MSKLGRLALNVTLVAAVLLMAQIASAITFNEFPVPTVGSTPLRISLGLDGNLWFTEFNGNKIGRITAGGTITEFPIPTPNSQPIVIVNGPDGNLWFTEQGGNNIGQISPAAVMLNEFPIPTSNSQPTGITIGPDGNLWFTEQSGNKIGRITTGGLITEFPIPTAGSQPTAIRPGPDGNIWFTENNGNKIGQISPAGVILNEFPIPTSNSQPNGLADGPDGNIWFCEENGNKIAKITTAGVITEYLIPLANNIPRAIRLGPDGNLWFTVHGTNGNRIGKITTEGVITEFVIPTPSSNPGNIAIGPDGNLWFTEQSGNKIGQAIINTGAMPVPSGAESFAITPPIPVPIITPVLAEAAPIGIGLAADHGDLLSVQIGFDQFSGPVDIYGAFELSTAPGIIRVLNPGGKGFHPFTRSQIAQAFSTGVLPTGLAPWVSNTLGNIYVPLFEERPISLFPSGTYTLFVAVFPSGSLSARYIWHTSFTLP